MFCAGNRDGIGPCDDDSGGGLYFNYNDVWFIRGLVSFTPFSSNTGKCDTNEYTVFIDVAKYLEWIEPKIKVTLARSLAQNCGRRKVPNFLIVNGTESRDGHWPWHVAIFHRSSRSFDYVCGGTILDQNTILTAAHCVMTPNGVISREYLIVQAGRNRLRITSNRAKEYKAFKLIVHPKYRDNSIQRDIALIKLATDITYTDYIQPICLWYLGEDQNAIVGSLGTVVGFGTDETDNLSNTLREARLPVVSAITCIESNRDSFATQLTSDMFCAGNRNGVGACNGDSGGGFFFNYNGVWYIRGLVSFTSPREGSILCDTKEYIVFTDVAKYLEWIEQSIGLDSAPTLEQYCGKRKMPAKDGYWPWHVALFYYNRRSFVHTCGGTILDQNTVLTAAHCLMTSKGIIARNSLVVKVGLNRESTAINHALDYEPFELIVHPEYNINSSRHDIALIKLVSDITYTDYIQPICLLDQGEDQNAIVGSLGTVISYTTDTLREAHLPVVSANTCIESNRNAFTSQLFPDMFCAGNRDGIEPNTGDAGGGFFFNYSDTWFIRGVVSFTPPRQHAATKEYTVFTDVSKYFKWIKKHMRETSDQPTKETNDQPTKETSDNNFKFGLLPMSTCGENPYASWEELSKPVLLGYPWVGLLEYTQTGSNRKIMICQATLISDLYLITSASCIKKLPRGYTLSSVRLGEYNQNTMTDCAVVEHYIVCSPPVQTLLIERVITHTSYNKPQYANDIALIRLRDRADTSQCNVKPICLSVTNKLRSQKSTHYTLTSWFFGNSGNLLERSERELIDTTECQQLYNDPLTSMKITTRQICIRQQQENNSECELFKEPLLGAPLQLVQQVRGDSRYVLHGVLSYGPNICGTSFPNVFTNVASYVDWILENMEE